MHLKYLSYVLRHKWFVFVAACKLGIPWRGLVHDLSKFSPAEWFPYVEHFHGKKAKAWRDNTGYYKPTDTGDPAFDVAWLHHANHNDHHWQYWTQVEDDQKSVKVHPMPDARRREMLADWRGAGRAQGKPDTLAWYTKNRDKMLLHPDTRAWIEEQLGYSVINAA